ncbi:phosphomannomutase [Aureimonas phyllosphaerae]|uniref:Phosphomannomutase n=1 Tax=Aureimonas phyllosphaerae TaxID=1166078 RepID=A0A7W6BRI5_9HYPH|nr:phosphomannomutase [Aureimonas phyllosphaerae]MBB3936754.1 phosphomannomutase [Aureimonas phyllosphaerae]MBB3960383.1 phosphomannomutase [Aureimonas phyllosphaerae]SFF22297.1 phosphomannomutase [Aureimonas phyllosphaerae]
MSSLKFGTSGLRGLVVDLVGGPAATWTAAFLAHLDAAGLSPATREVIVGQDLRSSSPQIAADCLRAASAWGWHALDAGALPTPALAQEAIRRGAAAVMVTGSHIPDDRNGLKFYRPDGEITKADETGIRAAFEAGQQAGEAGGEPRTLEGLTETYIDRIVGFFGPEALSGLRVGVYQQSSVARDVLTEALGRLGASPEPLARADRFIPVDTEAHRPEDLDLIVGWTADGRFDAIVSTDGDADRPLLADERGRIVRGDLLGLLTARRLGADIVVTPVTSSSSLERAPFLSQVVRTRVGSPFVIEGMEGAAGSGTVVGFEANGGVLVGSDVERDGRRLSALKTRDALLPIVATLAEAKAAGQSVSRVVEGLEAGAAAADRLPEIAADKSTPFLAMLAAGGEDARAFFAERGTIEDVNTFDGVRTTLADGSTVHYRASGNAPELRCYVEAGSEPAAAELLAWGLEAARRRLGA